MSDEHSWARRAPRPAEQRYRELIRTWGRRLRARGFADEQAARLIYTKLLYMRGSLRR